MIQSLFRVYEWHSNLLMRKRWSVITRRLFISFADCDLGENPHRTFPNHFSFNSKCRSSHFQSNSTFTASSRDRRTASSCLPDANAPVNLIGNQNLDQISKWVSSLPIFSILLIVSSRIWIPDSKVNQETFSIAWCNLQHFHLCQRAFRLNPIDFSFNFSFCIFKKKLLFLITSNAMSHKHRHD